MSRFAPAHHNCRRGPWGAGDLLLNNIAWALRRFPVYGNGDHPVQPVYVEDLAVQAVEAGSQSESFVADAAGYVWATGSRESNRNTDSRA